MEHAPSLQKTPLFELHQELGARMVPFAGHAMPVQYPSGIMKEHQHTRTHAGLFDVSHMGQLTLRGPTTVALLESLLPANVADMAVGQQRYSFFTNAHGGVLDDLMLIRLAEDHFLLVVNASCKTQDWEWLNKHLPAHGVAIESWTDRALLALQGPQAIPGVLTQLTNIDWTTWPFMTAQWINVAGISCLVSRSGYTGEDGVEISVPVNQTANLAREILAHPEVQPVGLGARDSLRLEAGLCLYGHDLTPETTPVEAALNWAIPKVRRLGGARAGGFPGASTILEQLPEGNHPITRKRIGLLGLEKTPVREGVALANPAGETVGQVTSGGYGPSIGAPIAMAYVEHRWADLGQTLYAQVRDKNLPMRVTELPFVAHRYYRKRS